MKQFLKKGNGASLLGLSLIVLTFVLGLLLIDYFNYFDAQIKTQTQTDAAVDAMAVAANDGSGVPNVKSIEFTKSTILNIIELSHFNTQIEKITYDKEYLFGKEMTPEEEEEYGIKSTDKALIVTAQAKTPFINSNYRKKSQNDHSHDYIYTHAYNVTRIMVSQASLRDQRFPDDIRKPAEPVYKHDKNDGARLDPDEYRAIVTQFEVELTKRYKPHGSETRESVYLWDVTSALGCELPYYFRTADGAPWVNERDGIYYDDGTIPYEMKNVDEITATVQGDGNSYTIKGYLPFLQKHMSCISNNYRIPYDQRCPAPYEDYSNWIALARDSSYKTTLQGIQRSANSGYPTILLFNNGSIWIVLPEIEETDSSRGLYVSYATTVPEDWLEGAFASNVSAHSVIAGYRIPTQNYIAISYRD